ncbi:hypothetical protein [Pseudomonas coleopterorum]|uniref:hypothetical protein n=1 Tax=Pseudomonas coleopterorum TaxID=1605838 RepID=UPI001784CEC3|nr:hypothetical protein [Pseudomonas coleopterorum]MBD8479829.1 hypothetical protein [Pseudomonas coleopterorum]
MLKVWFHSQHCSSIFCYDNTMKPLMKRYPKQVEVDHSPMDIFVQSNKGDAAPQRSTRLSTTICPFSGYIFKGEVSITKPPGATNTADSNETP